MAYIPEEKFFIQTVSDRENGRNLSRLVAVLVTLGAVLFWLIWGA